MWQQHQIAVKDSFDITETTAKSIGDHMEMFNFHDMLTPCPSLGYFSSSSGSSCQPIVTKELSATGKQKAEEAITVIDQSLRSAERMVSKIAANKPLSNLGASNLLVLEKAINDAYANRQRLNTIAVFGKIGQEAATDDQVKLELKKAAFSVNDLHEAMGCCKSFV